MEIYVIQQEIDHGDGVAVELIEAYVSKDEADAVASRLNADSVAAWESKYGSPVNKDSIYAKYCVAALELKGA